MTTSVEIPRSIALYADLSRRAAPVRGGDDASPSRKVGRSDLISERPSKTGTRHPRHELRPRSPLPTGRSIRSQFPGEGNHIPRSTVMVNEHSLRAVTESLPPACTPASVSGLWVHLAAPLFKPNSYAAAIIAPAVISAQAMALPLHDRYRYHLVPSADKPLNLT